MSISCISEERNLFDACRDVVIGGIANEERNTVIAALFSSALGQGIGYAAGLDTTYSLLLNSVINLFFSSVIFSNLSPNYHLS